MRKLLLGVFLLATVAMTPAFASSSSHDSVQGNELLFGTAASIPFTLSPFALTPTLTAGYQRAVMPNIQAGIRGFMGISTDALPWAANGWLVYNLDEKWTDSIFVGVGAGIVNALKAGNYLDVQISAEVGKRIELMHGLTWRPNLAMAKLLDGSVMNFSLNLVNFSYMW